MFKRVSLFLCIGLISACSVKSVTSYTSSENNIKTVINLDNDKIDQKSYATAYAVTVQSYQGRVNKEYHVNAFASGVKDWYSAKISVSINQIKEKLFQRNGLDSDVHTYYSGILFAFGLQTNFNRLSSTCWSHLDQASLTQGIYDAMLDLKNNRVRSEDDQYLVQGSEQILKLCVK
ncbi:hypothetical protein [Histophilus somni]|uniref:hypothetical protein n=1 Tax=Histophilus somni TaxID=731 RepID=UPI00094B0D76|nr:hypothetical protein [Histophilus somni]QEH18993.1 hypothetical protein FWK49_00550 [Histophilus somni]THA47321.1 hypothetical protein E5418_05675 [Histophilus somni]